MIEETIQQIEERLENAQNLSPQTRAELSSLLTKLRAEAAQLPTATERPANSAPRPDAETGTMQDSADQLRRSVEEFADSHPRLVQLANHVANTLAGLGI